MYRSRDSEPPSENRKTQCSQVEVIRKLVESYFWIVRKTMLDQVCPCVHCEHNVV